MHDQPTRKTFYVKRRKTPPFLQMQVTECGAVSLAMILGYYGKFVALEELRWSCGVSRNGSDAWSLLQAAREYGLEGEGYECGIEELFEGHAPAVVFWEHNHFLVYEGVKGDQVYLNDPALGHRTLTIEEFKRGFSHIVMELTPGPNFQKGGAPYGFWRSLQRRFDKVSWKMKGVMLFLQGILAFLELLTPVFTKVFIDEILGLKLLHWGPPLIAMMAGVSFISLILSAAQLRLLNYLAQTLTLGFSLEYIRHVFHLPMHFFETRYSSEIINRTHLNNTIMQMLSTELFTSAISLLFMLFYLVLMFFYSPTLTFFVLSQALILFFLWRYHLTSRTEAYASMQQIASKRVGVALDALQNFESYRVTNREEYLFTKITGTDAENLAESQKIDWKDILLSNGTSLIRGLYQAVLLGWGAIKIMEGELTVGGYVAFIMLTTSFLTPIQSLVFFLGKLQSLRVNLFRLDDVLDTPTDPLFTRKESEVVYATEEDVPILAAEELSFGYTPHKPPLVQSISMTFRKGTHTAIVGTSGAGKSTVGRLLTSLYEPWSGRVLFKGRNVAELSRRQLYTLIGRMDQQIFMPGGSLRDNITLWKKGVSDEELLELIDEVGLSPLLKDLNDGLYHLLHEGGGNLSQGQQQRLQLARVLLERPELIVLDEATSNLDHQSEKTVMAAIAKRGITSIMVTHRRSITMECDHIYVLDQGRIVESGNDEELMKRQGIYYSLMSREKDE